MAKKVMIKRIDIPAAGNITKDIDYISKSFGYFSHRDKQGTAGKIFRLLVKEACGEQNALTSDEIAEKLDLSRGTVVHHLNNFISTGLVNRENNKYRMRSPSLQKSIEELKRDIDRMFSQIIKIAMDIDERLGHYYR